MFTSNLQPVPTAAAMHFDLQEEVQALQDVTYAIEHELAVKNARPGQVDVALDGECETDAKLHVPLRRAGLITMHEQAPSMP